MLDFDVRICVFCGSHEGNRPEFRETAKLVGRLLAERGLGIVYGGGRVGLMGALADAALAAGGRVIGVIPEALAAREVAHRSVSELHVVGSMHERKALMAALADAFVALPGGFGTLEELFEVITWRQLGFHEKPCGLLNVEGYFDRLIAFMDDAVDNGFVHPPDRAALVESCDAAALIDKLLELSRAQTAPGAGPS
ncbi:MAG: TIGR00730 family Rossman fold protein [Vulcanimicrobiaceae bacterium]